MLRHIAVGFTLLAFVNFLMGCTVTSVDKVPPQEAERTSEKIAGLVLLDGTIIAFSSTGGKYVSGRPLIRGTSIDGTPLYVSLDSAWQIRTSPPISLTTAELDTASIAEVILSNDVLVMFGPPGGRYDKSADRITGKKKTGEEVAYLPARLKSIRAARPTAMTLDWFMGQSPAPPVYEVVNTKYKVFSFDSTGGRLERLAGIHGSDQTGRFVSVHADSVLYASVERVNAGATVLATLGLVVGVIGVIFLIALATKQSCPFVYAFNGQQFVFDAEPLGGAICPGLARTDISRLDHAKPVDGEYKLLVRNEVPETQYIDRMKMLLVDHAPGMSVYPDLQGRFYGFKNFQGVTSAVDERGVSLMNFLRASDGVAWQTHIPSTCKDTVGAVRHEITVTLAKPAGVKKAWLVTNIGTSSWGSNMIRKTVEYRGSAAPAWLASITPGSEALAGLNHFLEREEMYHLKTWVKGGSSWKQEGMILGQGPLISEDRVYPIDVSNAVGDSLILRFNPPKGFWTFDYIGVSYEEPTMMSALPIDARLAVDQGNRSLLDSLSATDGRYYDMPEVGNSASITFPAPVLTDGLVRSVYLETTGYYELHLAKDKPEQLARLNTIAVHPGQIVRAAMKEFQEWQAEQRSAVYPSQSIDQRESTEHDTQER